MISRKYEKYVKSVYSWLGDIPGEWKLLPLYSLLKEQKIKNLCNREENILSLSYGRIVNRDVSDNFGLLPESFETYQIVYSGNIILRLTDLQNDKRSLRVGLVTQSGIITSAYVCLKPVPDLDAQYASYLLHSYDISKVFYSFGGGVRQSMKYEDLKRVPIVLPSKDEQESIIVFLKKETSRIDSLIEKKHRQIELLQEKRSALISHVVTKGLRPDVRMKDSGIEWLEEIPDHWDIVQLKYVFRILNGSTPKSSEPDYWDGDIPWATPDDMGSMKGSFLMTTRRSITTIGYGNCGTSLAPAYSLVLSTRAPIGHLAIAGIPLCTNQGCRCLVFKQNENTKYFYYQILAAKSELVSLGQGSTFLELSRDKLSSLHILHPPIVDQKAIAEYLDRNTMRIDELIEKITISMNILNQYRTALISAAVTGKIDVRGEVA